MLFTCIKIFISRILDVSLGVLRTMYVVKGNKLISSSIAFIEILIWFYAAREALVNYDNSIIVALFYSLGYATGTYLGTYMNEMLISGFYNVQVITSNISLKDILKIKEQNYGLTVFKSIDNKYIINLSINKKRYKECVSLIKSLDKNAFIVVNDAKVLFNGYIQSKR